MSLEKAILSTVEYAKRYEAELSAKEIRRRLISDRVYDPKEVNQVLARMGLTRIKQNSKAYEEKMKKAEELAKWIGNTFRDVVMIGVTGSVAAANPDEEDDIDLMIITKTNKLWLTRMKLRWAVWKNGIPHRKFNQPAKKNDFCFNLWLDEGNYLIPKKRRNIKNAIDLILMKPVWDKNDSYIEFIKVNDWVKKWVATGYSEIISNPPSIEGRQFPISKKMQRTNFVDIIVNWFFFLGQVGYMALKLKINEVGLGKAFFHEK